MIDANHYPEMRLVWADLGEGYGAEDIAIRNGIDLECVRRHITQFRSQGKLPAMYGRAKKVWAKEPVK